MNTPNSLIVLFLSALILTACGQSTDADEPGELPQGWQTESLTHDGTNRVFRYYIPEELSDPYPVVMVFHGGGGNMNRIFEPDANAIPKWIELADRYGIMLIAPNGTDAETGNPDGSSQNWNDCRPHIDGITSDVDDVGFVNSLVDWADTHFTEKGFNPDMQRVFATGPSNGGMMTYRLAIELPGRIAAGASFIANLPDPSECTDAEHPLPMLIMNGTEDPLMPYDGGSIPGGRGEVSSSPDTRDFWISVNGADPSDPEITEYPDLDPDDGSRVICEDYEPMQAGVGAPVRYCRVEGGGHIMPSIDYTVSPGRQNRDVESAEVAWEFFSRVTLDE